MTAVMANSTQKVFNYNISLLSITLLEIKQFLLRLSRTSSTDIQFINIPNGSSADTK